MPFNLFSNAKAIAERHLRRSREARAEVERGGEDLRKLVQRTSIRWMNRMIYDIPIAIDPETGREEWVRTGNLRDEEKAKLTQTRQGPRIALDNIMRYAEIRHEMGKPKRRKTTRPAHWRDRTKTQLRSIANLRYQGALRTAIDSGRIISDVPKKVG